jgi:glutathione synthase/RimK-type ligase-like ATP-grasp enzyme
MPTGDLLVVSNPANWSLPLENVTVVSARDYLIPGNWNSGDYARVFNLCRSYSYQSLGYYVSLLAEARGQRAIPSVATLGDFRSQRIAHALGAEIDALMQTALRSVEGKSFSLAVYFGQSLDPNMRRLANQLYHLFPAPLLEVRFNRQERWTIASAKPIALSAIDGEERETIRNFAETYFRKRHRIARPKQRYVYDMAILVDPDEKSPPSDKKALERFAKAAREMDFYVEMIRPQDMDRIAEFDALFIRQTTAVDHVTYRLSRLAHAEGLVVIDDPWSILRSANKIYLAESLARAKLPIPHTEILTKEDLRGDRLDRLPIPLVLKIPDGSFSRGVMKVESHQDLEESLKEMLKDSDLIIAQEFVPSEYDWRIGVLDHQPLYACKYFMAKGHWQIYNWSAGKPSGVTGRCQTVHVETAPPKVVDLACRAARLIGDGFYGVDIKQVGERVMVIEVNDNPSIESGIEDAVLGMELYRRVARSFRRRIEQARG